MDKEIINKNTSWAFQTDPVHSYAYFLKAFSIEECENIIKIGKNKNLKKGTIFAWEIEKIINENNRWINN